MKIIEVVECKHDQEFVLGDHHWSCTFCRFTLNFDPFVAGMNRTKDWREHGIALLDEVNPKQVLVHKFSFYTGKG